ncbi:MAG: hypothetical protein ACXAES_14850 [Promethearchaeota archaeon]
MGETKAEEIEALLLERLKDLNENDLKKAFEFLEKYPNVEEKKDLLREMVRLKMFQSNVIGNHIFRISHIPMKITRIQKIIKI